MEYNFRETEAKWQAYWREQGTYRTENGGDRPKYYVLDMFPYPSGAGLHVGHPLGYIASDIVARYKRLKGFNVLHPMGFDAFGLPAEQYAIQTGQHPRITTEKNISRYREQLDKIGLSFDWSREVRTCNPAYYRWTQWIFLQLFKSWYNCDQDKAEPIETLIQIFETEGFTGCNSVYLTGEIEKAVPLFSAEEWKNFPEQEKSRILMNFRLAYLSEAWVNWCPALGTVLANDEVKDGVSERGGYPVERRQMPQWSLRITSYASRLLDDLEGIDWPDSVKEAQRNWIGRSEGTTVFFRAADPELAETEIEVFTTRPDTLFGVSFVTLAPEHALVEKFTTKEQASHVDAYVQMARNRSERERQADVKTISGVFTGSYVIHPFTAEKVPVWVGDYVLAGYGTGAVMAVPAHDSRDYAFAKHFGLPAKQVIEPPSGIEHDFSAASWDEKRGTCINSGFLNGLNVKDAVQKAISELEKKNQGKRRTNYRLRDAAFGRQRYWGEPIPVYYKDGIPLPLPESELPLVLPEIDVFQPTETGEPPLARAKNWKYKGEYEYENTTMPGWAGSSWYFLRYMDPDNSSAIASADALKYWKQVDLYIGGAEHSTGHLLYVRFWTKFLHDLGIIPEKEPAKKLINQGMIQGVSQYFYERRIAPELRRIYDERNVILQILENGAVLKELTCIIKNDYPIYYNYNYKNKSKLDLKFIDPTTKKEIKSIEYSDHAKTIFVEEFVVDGQQLGNHSLDLWLTEEPNFHPIVISDYPQNGIWHYKDRIWKDFDDNVLPNQDEQKWLTRPEVEKMSKSKMNVVSPDNVHLKNIIIPGIIEQYGADTLRLYEMFLGPLEQSKPWSTQGISGVHNFLRRTFRLFHPGQKFQLSDEVPTAEELKVLHRTIRKVEEDVERFSFNTTVSNFMICVNELTELKCNKRAILEPLLVILSPYAPHFAEELWQKCGHNTSITLASFPEWNEAYLAENAFDYPVSINGKMRFKINLSLKLSTAEIEKEVLSSGEMQRYLQGTPKKVIVVPGRIVNIVV